MHEKPARGDGRHTRPLAENITDHVKKRVCQAAEVLSRAVYTMFNSVVPVISWTLRRSLS